MLSLDSFKRVIKAEIPTAGEEQEASSLSVGHPIERIFGKFPTLKRVEEYIVDEAMKRANDNQGIAATFLGITRQALNKRLTRRKK
jgi:DNA-binding NtrC family response regulator